MTEKRAHDSALEVQGLSVHYGASPVLWDLSLSIPKGHLVGIMGPNGAGKTTFIRAVLDLIHKSTGSVHLLGHRLNVVRKKNCLCPSKNAG